MNIEALYDLYPNIVRTVGDVCYDENGDIVEIDEAQVNSWTAPDQYARDRLSEYPSIGEQLDMQYWDAVNGTTIWKDAIAQVKADNPKPE